VFTADACVRLAAQQARFQGGHFLPGGPRRQSFDAIQAVVPAQLDNYESEVLHLTTGCAVEVEGQLVPSQGKGQAVEIQASAVRVLGWVDDAESYPIAKKRHSFEYLRTQAHLRAAHQHLRRHHPRAPQPGQGDSQLLSRQRLLLGQHADHHRQ
jgi:hypothetical protein